jgi:tripartite-type tricarboxylate transporter receptor subunit TctC
MKTTGRLVLATIAALILATTDGASDSYPNRPITLVIPFPAGGPTDTIARPLAQALTGSLGQPVIVENRPGGSGGILGMRDVARHCKSIAQTLWPRFSRACYFR